MASTEQEREFEALRALHETAAGHTRGNSTTSAMLNPIPSTFASSDSPTASRASHLDASFSYRFGPASHEASKRPIQKPSPSTSSKYSVSNDVKKSLFPKYVAPGQNAAQLSQANNPHENLPDSEIPNNQDHEQNAEYPLSLGNTGAQSHLLSQTPQSAKGQAAKVVGRWSDVSGDAEELPTPALPLEVAEAYLARSFQAEGQHKRHAELLSFENEAKLRATKKKKANDSVSDSPTSISTSIPQSQPPINSTQRGVLGTSLKGVTKESNTGPLTVPASFEDAGDGDRLIFSMRGRGDDWKTIGEALKEKTGRNLANTSLRYRYGRMKSKSWEQPQDDEFWSNNDEKPAAFIGLPALVAKYRNSTIPNSKERKRRTERDHKAEYIRAKEKPRMKKEQGGSERQTADNHSFGDSTGEDEVLYVEPTGSTSQNNVSSDQKHQIRLDLQRAKRQAKLDEHEKEIRAALRRFHPEQGNDDLFVEGGEQGIKATSVYQSSTSSDEDEDDQYQNVKLPPRPLPTNGHAATATKTVSEASQNLDEDAEEVRSDDDGEPETSYIYHVGRRVTHIESDGNPLGTSQGTSQSELGPFYTLAEANITAQINVRPTTTEAFLFSSGLKSINCELHEADLQAWTATSEMGKIQTFVTREISTTSLPPTTGFRIPQYLYLVQDSSTFTSASPHDNTPKCHLTQQPGDIFTTLDLANKEAAFRWLEHATKHLDMKKPLDDIEKVEMRRGLRGDVRLMNEGGVRFARDLKEDGGGGKVWVEVSMVKGPRN